MPSDAAPWHATYDYMDALAESGWKRLRAKGSVVFVDRGLHGVPTYYVMRRADVLEVLRDSTTFVRVGDTTPAPYRLAAQRLLAPPALDEVMPDALRERATLVINTATALTAAGEEVTPADIGNMFAEYTFLALCGIAHDEELPQAVAERRTRFLLELSDRLTDDAEVIKTVECLVLAGALGISYAVQFALVDLSRYPARCQELRRAETECVAEFVDEQLRRRSPIPTAVRNTTTAVTIAGVRIPEGSRVELCLAPEDNERPSGHLEFGAGVHRCIGRHLSRMALTVFIEQWLRMVP